MITLQYTNNIIIQCIYTVSFFIWATSMAINITSVILAIVYQMKISGYLIEVASILVMLSMITFTALDLYYKIKNEINTTR